MEMWSTPSLYLSEFELGLNFRGVFDAIRPCQVIWRRLCQSNFADIGQCQLTNQRTSGSSCILLQVIHKLGTLNLSSTWPFSELWLSMVSTNHRRRYEYNVFSNLLIPCSAIDIKCLQLSYYRGFLGQQWSLLPTEIIFDPVLISNHMTGRCEIKLLIHSQMSTVARCSLVWISNFILSFIMNVITHPCQD